MPLIEFCQVCACFFPCVSWNFRLCLHHVWVSFDAYSDMNVQYMFKYVPIHFLFCHSNLHASGSTTAPVICFNQIALSNASTFFRWQLGVWERPSFQHSHEWNGQTKTLRVFHSSPQWHHCPVWQDPWFPGRLRPSCRVSRWGKKVANSCIKFHEHHSFWIGPMLQCQIGTFLVIVCFQRKKRFSPSHQIFSKMPLFCKKHKLCSQHGKP